MRNKIITTYTNSKMNIRRKIMGLCTGACLLGHCSKGSLGLFRTLVRVLFQVSIIKRDTLRSGSIRWHQLVISVREINRFYMQCKIMTYLGITISFLHNKVVVQQKLIQWWSQNFIPWVVIYRVVITTMFLHEWVWGFGFHCYHLDIACFYYFITTIYSWASDEKLK